MSKLVLIDGNAIIHRAYHAYPPLTTSKGELINAVYGFLSILFNSLKQLQPKYVAVAFDKKAPTFRHKQYQGYKAHRPKMDQELADQIKRVYQVVKVLNIPVFAQKGFEADDMIGTLVKKASTLKQPKLETIIITGDKDILQLLTRRVKVFFPPRGKKPAQIYDQKLFCQQYGFLPQQLVDFKALAGDSSDEIPGVKGIGPKTAQKLIIKFGSLKNIYHSLAKIKQWKNGAKIANLLQQNKDKAFLSQKLAAIITNVPLDFNLSKCLLLDYNQKRVKAVFESLEFKSLINRLPDSWKSSFKNKVKNKTMLKQKKPKSLENQTNQMELF